MKKSTLLVLCMCAIAVIGLVGRAPRLHARTNALRLPSEDPPQGPGVYRIKSGANVDDTKEFGACVGYSPDVPNRVLVIACNLGQRALVTFIKHGGNYLIRNGDVNGPRAGRCLDSDSSRDDDTILAPACNRTEYQQWTLRKFDNGTYEIKNVKSGQCLDRNSYRPGYNSDAHLVNCNGSAWQSWWLEYEREN